MPDANVLSRLGVFLLHDFADHDICQRICSEVNQSKTKPAEITCDRVDRIDEAVRKTKVAKISDATKELVKRRLSDLQPLLEKHFSLSLTDCEDPQFLTYNVGDFFHPHHDSSSSPEAYEYVRTRKVSVVVFLNPVSEVPSHQSYRGGELVLYGLIADPLWKRYGFTIQGESGLLVAFRSDILHEVTPVTRGKRFTIVSWFF
jgi:SM-20-related protein